MIRPERLSDAVTLYQGDCLEVLPTLTGIDAVVTDPPYGIAYQSARRTDKRDWFPVIHGDDKPQTEWMPSAKSVLSDTGCVLCFCEWKHAETFRSGLEYAGFHIGAQLVWDRVVPGMGDPSSRPSPAHDLIWFAVHGSYRLPGRRPSSVYRVQRLGGHELVHPTQKPIELMADLIRDFTPSSSTILDPFAGSGTTGVAAAIEGRKCILIEKDPRYCDIIRRRIADAEANGPQSLFKNVKHPDLFAESTQGEICV